MTQSFDAFIKKKKYVFQQHNIIPTEHSVTMVVTLRRWPEKYTGIANDRTINFRSFKVHYFYS